MILNCDILFRSHELYSIRASHFNFRLRMMASQLKFVYPLKMEFRFIKKQKPIKIIYQRNEII